MNVDSTTMKFAKMCGFHNPNGVSITMMLVETNSIAKESWGLMGRHGYVA